MGNLKTALRFGAGEGLPLQTVLEKVNRVLPAVKQPEMYATFAGMCSRTNGEIEYCFKIIKGLLIGGVSSPIRLRR